MRFKLEVGAPISTVIREIERLEELLEFKSKILAIRGACIIDQNKKLDNALNKVVEIDSVIKRKDVDILNLEKAVTALHAKLEDKDRDLESNKESLDYRKGLIKEKENDINNLHKALGENIRLNKQKLKETISEHKARQAMQKRTINALKASNGPDYYVQQELREKISDLEITVSSLRSTIAANSSSLYIQKKLKRDEIITLKTNHGKKVQSIRSSNNSMYRENQELKASIEASQKDCTYQKNRADHYYSVGEKLKKKLREFKEPEDSLLRFIYMNDSGFPTPQYVRVSKAKKILRSKHKHGDNYVAACKEALLNHLLQETE